MSYHNDAKESMKYKVEEALEALIKAEDIRSDKKMMAEVMKLAGVKKKAISSIADLKEAKTRLEEEESKESPQEEQSEEEADKESEE